MSEISCIKCIVVGDSCSEKANFLSVYGDWNYDDHSRIISKTIQIDGQMLKIDLWDTISDDYSRLHTLSYPKADVFLIFFSLVDRDSYENVIKEWYPDVQYYSAHAPVILVGTKSDMRNQRETVEDLKRKNLVAVTYAEGLDMAKQIKAVNYFECASPEKSNLDAVIEAAARAALFSNKSSEKTNDSVE